MARWLDGWVALVELGQERDWRRLAPSYSFTYHSLGPAGASYLETPDAYRLQRYDTTLLHVHDYSIMFKQLCQHQKS